MTIVSTKTCFKSHIVKSGINLVSHNGRRVSIHTNRAVRVAFFELLKYFVKVFESNYYSVVLPQFDLANGFMSLIWNGCLADIIWLCTFRSLQ